MTSTVTEKRWVIENTMVMETEGTEEKLSMNNVMACLQDIDAEADIGPTLSDMVMLMLVVFTAGL